MMKLFPCINTNKGLWAFNFDILFAFKLRVRILVSKSLGSLDLVSSLRLPARRDVCLSDAQFGGAGV